MSIWGTPLILNPPDVKPDYSGIYIEQGNISSSTGADSTTSQASRLRTHGYILISDTNQYQINCNIPRVYVYYYNQNQSIIGSGGAWITPLPAIITPPSGAKYMRCVLSKSSGNVSPSDVTSFTVDEMERIINLP